MSQIWKQPLELTGNTVTTVETSGLLHVGIDANGVPCVWFWAPEENRATTEVVLFGTGHDIPEASVDRYLGTFIWRTLVLHAFERLPS